MLGGGLTYLLKICPILGGTGPIWWLSYIPWHPNTSWGVLGMFLGSEYWTSEGVNGCRSDILQRSGEKPLNFTYRFTRLLPQPWFSGTCVPSRWTSFKIEVFFLFFHRKKWWWGVQGFPRVGVRTVTAFFVVDIFGHFCHCFCVKTLRKSRWRILGFAPTGKGWWEGWF